MPFRPAGRPPRECRLSPEEMKKRAERQKRERHTRRCPVCPSVRRSSPRVCRPAWRSGASAITSRWQRRSRGRTPCQEGAARVPDSHERSRASFRQHRPSFKIEETAGTHASGQTNAHAVYARRYVPAPERWSRVYAARPNCRRFRRKERSGRQVALQTEQENLNREEGRLLRRLPPPATGKRAAC